MPRCSTCQKFVSLDTETDPEVNDIDVDGDGNVTASARIVNSCGDCSEELAEANLEMTCNLGDYDNEGTYNVHLKEHHGADEEGNVPEGKEPELTVDEDGCERTSRSEGKGRGTKTFYGAKIDFTVKCGCGQWECSGSMEDDIQASAMDSLQ